LDSLTVGKIDAAIRQLDTAIGLFFSGNDILAVHSLADAAVRVLEEAIGPQAGSADWHGQVQTTLNLDTSTYETVLRRTQDMLSPDQRDPNGNVNPRQTVARMIQALMTIAGLGVRPSVPQAVLQLWYLACMLNELPNLRPDLRSFILQRFRDLSRRTAPYQLAVGRRVLQEDIERNRTETAATVPA
jgi:hypothetical protein